jgi:hypothetical protein
MEQNEVKRPWWVTTESFAAALFVVSAWTFAFIVRVVGLFIDKPATGFDWFITGVYLFCALAWTPTVIYQWREKKRLKKTAADK